MPSHPPSNETPAEVTYEAVPGYPKIFLIALGVMALYLAIILVSSPGTVDHYGKKGKDTHPTETAH